MTNNKDTKGGKPRTSGIKKKDPAQNKKTQPSKDQEEVLQAKEDHTQDSGKAQGQEEGKKMKRQSAFDEFGNQVEKIAIRTAESIRKVVDKALASRNTVLTIRVNDESNKKMNMLVDAGLFKSRSESAAFLIQEGIKSQSMFFNKISTKLEEIEKIREELQIVVSEEFTSKKLSEKK